MLLSTPLRPDAGIPQSAHALDHFASFRRAGRTARRPLVGTGRDNGAFCDGEEICHATLDCQAGTSPTLSDGVEWTDDSCDEALDVVMNTANDANCDDGNECTADACDDVLGCTHDAIPGCSVPVPVASDSGRMILVMMLALVTFGFAYWRRHPLGT